ncbi:MAG: hypothetical protein ABSB19_14815, partial [Methylomonas sp.]
WTATNASSNNGVANIYTNGLAVDASVVGGNKGLTITNTAGATTLTAGNNDTLVAGSGSDTLVGNGGADTLIGGTGSDTFQVNKGIAAVSNFGASEALTVNSGATANVSLTSAWTIGNADKNNGTVNISASGLAVDVSKVGGTGKWSITDTGTGSGVTLTAGSNDTLVASGGANDILVGGAGGGDTFNVGAGNVTINNFTGSDVLIVGASKDSAATATLTLTSAWTATSASSNYGTVDITANGQAVNVTQAGGNGFWNISNSGSSTATTLTGGGGQDSLTAGSGNDTLIANGGAETLAGGAGTDTFLVEKGLATVSGYTGSELLTVSSGATAALTASGTWTPPAGLKNNGTVNVTTTGNAVDASSATTGNWNITDNGTGAGTTLKVGVGKDTLTVAGGSTTVDTVTGGSGVDTFNVTGGTASITNFTGSDVLTVGSSTDSAATAALTLTSAWTATSASSNYGTVNITTNGQAINVSQAGGGGVWNISNNGKTATTLTGGTKAILSAGTGNDTLVDNGGADTLVGGSGADTFQVTKGTASISNFSNSDVLTVNSGATANVTLSSAWTATSADKNNGTVNITASGEAVDVSKAGGTGKWNITDNGTSSGAKLAIAANDTVTVNGGASTIDSIVAGSGQDTFTVNSGAAIIQNFNLSDNLDVAKNADASVSLTNQNVVLTSSEVTNAGSITLNYVDNTTTSATIDLSQLTSGGYTINDASTIGNSIGINTSYDQLVTLNQTGTGVDSVFGFNAGDVLKGSGQSSSGIDLFLTGANSGLTTATDSEFSHVVFYANAADTTINLSNLTQGYSVFGVAFSQSNAVEGNDTISGGSGGITVLAAQGDVLTGGAVTGGAINTYEFASAFNSITDPITITNYAEGVSGVGDQIQYLQSTSSGLNIDALSFGGGGIAASATTAAIDQHTGVATFSGAVTLDSAIADIVNSFVTAGEKDGNFAFFNVSGTEYLLISDGKDAISSSVGVADSHDTLIKLVGIAAVNSIDTTQLTNGGLTIVS